LTTIPIFLGLLPRHLSGDSTCRSGVKVALLEMNAAVASRHSRLICSIGERRPGERHVPRRHQTGLDLGTACPERGGAPKAIAPSEELEDLGSGGTEAAVAGRILWERWSGKAGGLIREPRRPVDEHRALIRSA